PTPIARARLISLYKGNLVLDLSELDVVIERTAGVTASFIKELLRRAALQAAEDDDGDGAARRGRRRGTERRAAAGLRCAHDGSA
ncbi:MAG TPA: hypothetical protein VF506_14135, partial [Streptosporangiaceae bacterium]